MKITKLGHCCFLLEERGVRMMTDPGVYSTAQNDVKNIDLVLITHEHADHFHLDSLKVVLANNPAAKVLTNSAVGALLAAEGISYELVEKGQKYQSGEVVIESYDQIHAPIYPGLPQVQNTGYFIADRFFYPGDALTDPSRPIEILGLPLAGP